MEALIPIGSKSTTCKLKNQEVQEIYILSKQFLTHIPFFTHQKITPPLHLSYTGHYPLSNPKT